jgi:hypothetical protein
MVLETAQMLAAACNIQSYKVPGPRFDLPYKLTHHHHPCAVWARKNRANYSWLIEHGLYLNEEVIARYGEDHESVYLVEMAARHRDKFPDNSELVFDFNSSGFDTGDVFHDYKLCLVNKWKNIDEKPPKWSYRGRPSFVRELINHV